eukprot:6173933-Pleurochrysis_carterae.AAC.2
MREGDYSPRCVSVVCVRKARIRRAADLAPRLFLDALLTSPHRTSHAAEADLFFVPIIEYIGCWGTLGPLYHAHRQPSSRPKCFQSYARYERC